MLPCSYIGLQGWQVGHTAIQALPAQDTELDLRDVEPAAMLGRVVDLQLVGQSFCLGRGKGLVE